MGGTMELLDRTLGSMIGVNIVRPDGLWKAMTDPGRLDLPHVLRVVNQYLDRASLGDAA